MMTLILVNNSFMERKEFCADIEDRAYQFGDGVYEVIRVYGGKLFALEEHLIRLWNSAREVMINIPFEKNHLGSNLVKLAEANKLENGIIYLQLSRGVAPRAHHFPQNAGPVMVGYTKRMERPLKSIKGGEKAITFEDIRWMRCDIKSLNLLGNVMAKQAAVEKGAVEAILHRGDTITEGSSSNFFIIKKGKIHTHPCNNFILNGVTRQFVVKLAGKLKLALHEDTFTVQQAYEADEAFITSTTSEVLPITGIDDHIIADGRPGSTTLLIQEAFEELIGIN